MEFNGYDPLTLRFTPIILSWSGAGPTKLIQDPLYNDRSNKIIFVTENLFSVIFWLINKVNYEINAIT